MLSNRRIERVLEHVARASNYELTGDQREQAAFYYVLKYGGQLGMKKLARRLRKLVHNEGAEAVLWGV